MFCIILIFFSVIILSMGSIGDQQDKLVAVVQVFRHGERTPSSATYPTDPYSSDYYKPIEPGELTNKGKRQIYDLGQYVRQRYAKFLPSIYSKKDFHIYTTNLQRSITSAQLYTAGLYPPTKQELWNEKLQWNPIPTYVAEPPILRSTIIDICPPYKASFDAVCMRYLEEHKNDPLIDYLVKHSGFKLEHFGLLGQLHEALSVQASLGMKLPEWAEKVIDKMDFTLKCQEGLVKTERMKMLFIGPLLNEIIYHFERMVKDPTSGPKLTAYSGHDSNISGLLITLGAFKRQLPVFGSSIFFELKKRNEEYYVNIYYRGKEVVPISLDQASFDCKLSDFKNLLRRYTITKDHFYEICSM